MGYVEDLRKIVGHRPVIFVGAVAIIVNPNSEVLLQKRVHPYGVWGLPGGLMELGESVEDTARREVFEETNLTVHEMNLVGIFSGPGHFVTVANGDEFYVVTAAFSTQKYSGTLQIDPAESLDFAFIHPTTFPDKMVGSHRRMIYTYLKQRDE